jgi:hypothetical protein
MTVNLLGEAWKGFDSYELRLLLDKHIGGPGQYHGSPENPDRLYLPLAESACRVVLTFRDSEIVAIEPGPAFDAAEWERIGAAIETSLLAGPPMVGREYSFSSFRVPGSWRGERLRVQILPPPAHAPCAEHEMAEHPFILGFPMQASDHPRLTNHRRLRQHRKPTLAGCGKTRLVFILPQPVVVVQRTGAQPVDRIVKARGFFSSPQVISQLGTVR